MLNVKKLLTKILASLKSPLLVDVTNIPSTTVSANNSVWAYQKGWTVKSVAGYTPIAVVQATPDNQSSLIMQVTINYAAYGNRFIGSVRNISGSNLTDTFTIPVLYIRNELL